MIQGTFAKHLQAAFGTPEQGINTGPVHGGERELRRLYLPPFKRAIMDSGAWSVMSSYNSYDGVPTVADHHLLTDILRNEWGYEYFVISDAGGTARVADAFSICARDDNECITTEVSHIVMSGSGRTADHHRFSRPAMMWRWVAVGTVSRSSLR